VQTVIPPEAILGYTTGGAVLTLVLPLGFFIVVMAAFFIVFSRPHTVPGHRERVRARPEAPGAEVAAPIAAAAGFPTATSAGGPEPLADRATPPVIGAARENTAGAAQDAAAGDSGKEGTASPEDTASSQSAPESTASPESAASPGSTGDTE
jgi:hypothetical protein